MFYSNNAVAAATATSLEGINFTPMDRTTRPTAKSCQQLKKDLAFFLLSVQSTRGGGRHGHLALMYTAADYQALPGAPAARKVPDDDSDTE